jgi:transcriptional regulator with XRE-family HTH domain
MRTLGERLRTARERQGLSQQEVAKSAHITQQALSRYESGARQHVRSDVLIRLADALGCSTDYLLGRVDNPTPA